MTAHPTEPAPPPRGTRPRNRRALIIAAATDLFYRRGYDQISMSDIAEAVAIRPSALYRHFSGKQDLLHAVLLEGLTPIRELLTGVRLQDRATALLQLGAIALDHRELGVLWQREARHALREDHANLRAELRGIGHLLTSRIQEARPQLGAASADLLTWATVAVLMSTSFHHLHLPRPEFDNLIAELVGLVLDTEVPDLRTTTPQADNVPGLVPRSRREALLTQAVRMFAREGYTGIGLEGIGAALGVTGTSIYNHFSSKRDILTTAFNRGTARLFMDLNSIYETATDAPDGLRRLVHSYVHFTQEHHNLVDLLITETEHLPNDERRDARQVQHEYVSEWVHLLHTVRPGLDPTVARIRVHAALAVANDAARTPHLRRNPAVPAILETICTRVILP